MRGLSSRIDLSNLVLSGLSNLVFTLPGRSILGLPGRSVLGRSLLGLSDLVGFSPLRPAFRPVAPLPPTRSLPEEEDADAGPTPTSPDPVDEVRLQLTPCCFLPRCPTEASGAEMMGTMMAGC